MRFKLTKFTSNNRHVLESIPEERRRINAKDIDLNCDYLKDETALGVHWKVQEDSLGFQITLKEKPTTRRGILSVISSIYDPLGLAAPFLLKGKQIMQQLCQAKLGWDDCIPEHLETQWKQWKSQLKMLEEIEVDRCIKPKKFGKVVNTSLHHFSDASDVGYGQATYIRLVNRDGDIHCSLLIGKSRVAPLKTIAIPRMELIAATVSVKVASMVKKQIELNIDSETFWTDSKVVLGYIQNESKRFKVFVANRVQLIHENSGREQWKYVNTSLNPADYASRGIDPSKIDKSEKWFYDPSFLWKKESDWNLNDEETFHLHNEDPEVKNDRCVYSTRVSQEFGLMHTLETGISDWNRMKRLLAYMLKFICRFTQSKD